MLMALGLPRHLGMGKVALPTPGLLRWRYLPRYLVAISLPRSPWQ